MKWAYAFHEDVLEANMHDLLEFHGKQGWELVSCNRFKNLEGGYGNAEEVVRYALVFKKPLEGT